MDPEIVSRLQSFNARRKLRAAAFASVWSSTIFLKTKKLRSLLGSHDLTPEELNNLRMNFNKMQVHPSSLIYLPFGSLLDTSHRLLACASTDVPTVKMLPFPSLRRF